MNTAKQVTPDVTLDQLAEMLKQLDSGAVVTPAVSAQVEQLDTVVPEVDVAAMDELAELEKNAAPAASTPEPDIVQQMPLDVGDLVLEELERKNAIVAKKRPKSARPSQDIPPQQKPAPTQPHGRFDLMGMNDGDWLKVGLVTDAKTSLDLIRECPVKVQEKALNIAQWMLRGNLLSVFTELCLGELINVGSATSASLRVMLMSNPDKMYSAGTAGSQAGQMMKLLPVMGVAKVSGKTLTLIPDSPVVEFFRKNNA